MNVVASSTDGADYIVAQQAAADALPAAGTPWLDASRDKAKAILADVGLPTTRLEDWKYIKRCRSAPGCQGHEYGAVVAV